MKVPFLDLRAQYASIKSELMPRCSCGVGQFVRSRSPRSNEFAAYCQTARVGVNIGTSARCTPLGIGPGDEVITAAFGRQHSRDPLLQRQAVLVDIDPHVYDAGGLPGIRDHCEDEGNHSVHLYGQPADISSILAVGRQLAGY